MSHAYESYIYSSFQKYALHGMTQIAALESIPSKIRVNAVCPAVIETETVTRALAAVPGQHAIFRSTNPMVGPEVGITESL